jgi:crotonobetainyl-CoA:carnitine CoA-transferase CaiB-like acyl-CoA transferase
VEGGIVCLSESIATFTANGDVLGRMGNRSRHAAPHGVFRCADEDGRERWIAIAIHDDQDWQRLVQALGTPDWAVAPELGTLSGRLAHAEALEDRLSEWTRTDRAAALAERLQHVGVDAAAVADLGTCTTAGWRRGHFRTVEHPVLGSHPVETHAIRFSAMAPSLRRPAPRLRHTAHRPPRPARHACRRLPPAEAPFSTIGMLLTAFAGVPQRGVTLWRTQVGRKRGASSDRARHRPEARGRGA